MDEDPVLIAPSLLSADFACLEDEIRRVEDGGADLLHLDVMDGHFVPNITFGLPVVEAIRRVTQLKLDTHLMLSNPGSFLEQFREAGADSLTVHLEVEEDVPELIDRIRSLGLECGLALNPATPVESVFPHLRDLDLVLVMSVEPGFGGQSFRPEVLQKARALRLQREERSLSLTIAIDGGVKPENSASCRAAGADLLVAGSAVFSADDPATVIQGLRGQGGAAAR